MEAVSPPKQISELLLSSLYKAGNAVALQSLSNIFYVSKQQGRARQQLGKSKKTILSTSRSQMYSMI